MMNTSVAGTPEDLMRSGRLSTAMARTFSGALLLLGALQTQATIIQYKSFRDLMKESDAVVSGRVARIESKYSANKEDIYTFVTLDQVETLSGSYAAPTLTLRFLGGHVDNDMLHVEGSPNFKQNEKVIVFVHGNGRYIVPVVGWTQGVFRVVPDAATGKGVVSDHEGNRVFGVQNGTILKDSTHEPEARIVGPQGMSLGRTKNMEGNAGSPDFIAPREAGAASLEAPQGLAGPRLAMTDAVFESAIRSAAVSGTAAAVLRSVGPNDADVAVDKRAESVGATPASIQAGQPATPVLPKRTEPQTANDQR